MIDEQLCKRLKLLRNKLDLNRAELARSIHFVPSMVSQVEKGRVQASTRFIAAICHAHGVSEEWLLRGDGPMFKRGPVDLEVQDAESPQMADKLVRYTVTRKYPEELQPYIDAVIEVIQSGDEVIATALKQNLEAFRVAISRGRKLVGVPKKENSTDGAGT